MHARDTPTCEPGRGLPILLLLPSPRDTELAAQVLRDEGMSTVECDGIDGLRDALRDPVGAVFVAEEWLVHGASALLSDMIALQPSWSDVPIVVVARSNSDSPHLDKLLETLGNASLLERPARVAALTSAARTALRARQRQYQIRTQLDDLEQARAELDAAARRKDEFLAMLGHELRNPLAPILNTIEVLLRGPDHRDRGMLATMRRQVDHMVRLVDDLVDVARLTHGTIELRLQPTSLSDALHSAIALSRPLVESGGHALETDLAPEAMFAMADATRLAQVFSNLINNAAKYSSPHGSIKLSLRREGTDAVVRIADRGIGIEAGLLPRIFDLFTQGGHSRQDARGGLGIGLTLVRSLVRMHGGSIDAHSDGPGQGSQFTVRLPLLVEAFAGVPSTKPAEPGVPADIRVLVVDDNVDAAETMGLLLDALGVEHRVAFDGTDALRRVDEWGPDVVLLDLGMPGMDGYEVARRIRARHPAVALVALTGWSQPEEVARTQAAGFSEHLSKPVSPDRIAALLGRIHAKVT